MEYVNTRNKSYQEYKEIIDKETEIELEHYINKMKNKKAAMVNATSFGGGVAEMLHSYVPLAKDMGLEMDWWTMKGSDEFYHVTKSFHNCLQGQEGRLTEEAKKIYLKYNSLNAENIQEWNYDYVIIHDPQPAALIDYLDTRGKTKWIWRCHIDTSLPNEEYWDFLYQYIKKYDACIFTMRDFVKEDENLNKLNFITPSIDPLSSKNIPLKREEAQMIISRFGVDINRPIITQVSRFDPWKDPLGVIDAYRIIKKEFPSVQLVLIGSMASDDPEGWDYLYRTLRRAGEDYDIKVITNFNGVSHIEVNAFQTASDIILQKSIKEGFGLTVSEGLWKGTPVIGGNAGGIKYQIEDGISGYVVNTVEECAERAIRLLRNPMIAEEMSEAGRERVRKNFLITTGILNFLKLFDELDD
ncbi:MAG: glycosyltransferase [Clostridiales bacterium]|nr:glycosyltransferase [Clostridiales bacterium]MCF8021879.1 glycosyltransferase [Clostridiales bacterium]